MARMLDQIVVVDLEATCWEGAPPHGQESEIIEVGVCLLDVATGERLERESILVRPDRSTVSAFCTGLTTLTQAQVEAGIAFVDACQIVRHRYQGKERTWASYGDYDRRQFEKQCQAFGLTYPFGPTHINVKNLFALAHGLPHEVGLDEAARLSGFALEGTHHRGDDDAWNIARVLGLLLQRLRAAGPE
jgi:inhibitor of KinA sporulation pathway (predicted exonuclease)